MELYSNYSILKVINKKMNIAVFEHDITTRIGGGYRRSDGYEYRYRFESETIVLTDSNNISIDILLLIIPFINERKGCTEYETDFRRDEEYTVFSQQSTNELVNIINKEIFKNSNFNFPIDYCLEHFPQYFFTGKEVDLHDKNYINIEECYTDIYDNFIKQEKEIRDEVDTLYYIRLLNNLELPFELNKRTRFFANQFPIEYANNKNSMELMKILLYRGARKFQDFSCIYRLLQCKDKYLQEIIVRDIIKKSDRLIQSCLRRAILSNDLYLVTLLINKVKDINDIYFYHNFINPNFTDDDNYINVDMLYGVYETNSKDFKLYATNNLIGFNKEFALKSGYVFTFMSLAFIVGNNAIIDILAHHGAHVDFRLGGYSYQEIRELNTHPIRK